MNVLKEEELASLRKDSGIDIIEAIMGLRTNEKHGFLNGCGVYIITTIDEERYVGSSSNILKRITYHPINNIDTIDVFLTSDYRKLEKWFIHQIRPSLNIIIYDTERSDSLIKTQKRYQEKNPVIRIDIETYNILMKYSEANKTTIKNTISLTIKENDMLKVEVDLLKKEVEQLRIENDLLKVDNSKMLSKENDLLKVNNILSKEKKGLKEGLKGLFFK